MVMQAWSLMSEWLTAPLTDARDIAARTTFPLLYATAIRITQLNCNNYVDVVVVITSKYATIIQPNAGCNRRISYRKVPTRALHRCECLLLLLLLLLLL